MSMQPVLLSFPLQPDRWEVAQANQLLAFELLKGKFEKRLCGCKSIRPARTLRRFPVKESKVAGKQEQPLAHKRDGVVAHQLSVQEIVVCAYTLHLCDEAICGEALVCGAGKDEALKRTKVDRVRWHSGVEDCLALRRLTHGADVANCAIQEDAVNALSVALRNTYRQVLAVFIEKA